VTYQQSRRLLGILSLAAALLSTAAANSLAAPPGRPLNVLFIAVDDLRPQLGCYGVPNMATPRLDQLAAEGRRFDYHYVQVPTCGASRCAMLTGRYPASPGAYDNGAFATLPRVAEGTLTSMPELFRRAGYATAAIGKITHEPGGTLESGEHELASAWDETDMPAGKWKDAWSAFFAYADGSTRVPGKTPATERGEVDDAGYPDTLIADATIDKLKKFRDKPFFLSVGFIKPHLPFNAPASAGRR
jgi:iduronate 2-sulfatase